MLLLYRQADFEQVHVMAGASNAAAKAGACHNFSLEWLRLMYERSPATDASDRMSALEKKRGGAAMVTQKVFGEQWTAQGMADADKAVAAWRNLDFAGSLVSFSPYTKQAMTNGIDKTDVAGMVYSFWFSGSVPGADGAHTIAFFRNVKPSRGSTAPSDNIVFCFDPNFGEYEIPSKEVSVWIDKLFGEYGSVDDHVMRKFKKI